MLTPLDMNERRQAGLAVVAPGRVIEPPKAAAPRPPYQVLSESIAQALKPVGQRLSTGIATLDHATRGGLPLGRLVTLLGPPGAAKTTLACWLLDNLERQGCACAYLAADEPSEGIITRFGQLDGWSRDGLESEGDAGDAIRAGFAQRAQGKPLTVIDPDADERLSTIEDAEAALLHLAGDRPRAMTVDSLQTARCRAAEAFDSQRERIDAKIATLKAIAKRGTLVFLISEMARGAYRSGDRSQDTSALAAGKESGAIEYGASLLLGLRSVKGEQGLVDVEVAKNRLGGSKPEFRLRLDFDRASFSEMAIPAPEELRSSARTSQVESDARELTQALLVRPGLGARHMRAEARAQLGWGTARLDAALACLRHGHDGYRAVNRGSDRAAEWHIEAVTEDV